MWAGIHRIVPIPPLRAEPSKARETGSRSVQKKYIYTVFNRHENHPVVTMDGVETDPRQTGRWTWRWTDEGTEPRWIWTRQVDGQGWAPGPDRRKVLDRRMGSVPDPDVQNSGWGADRRMGGGWMDEQVRARSPDMDMGVGARPEQTE